MMKILSFVSLLLLLAETSAQVTVTLKNQTALRGENATIPCSYNTEEGITGFPVFTWYVIRAGSERLRLFRYYSDPERRVESFKSDGIDRNLTVDEDGSLVLFQVSLDDNKDYSHLACEVDFGQPGNNVGEMVFTVVVLPEEEPTASFGDKTSFDPSEGRTELGFCRTGAGFPAPKVILLRNGQPLQTSNSVSDGKTFDESSPDGSDDEFTHNFITEPAGDGTFQTKSYLFSTVSVEDDKTQFSCKVISGLGDNENTQQVNFPSFRVNHATTEITIDQNPSHAFLGEAYELTCKANGYPEPKITFDGKDTDTLQFTVTKADIDRAVVCQAGGILQDTVTIDVLYADTPIVTGRTSVNLGADLDLGCQVTSNPGSVNVNWIKDKETIFDEDILRIPNVTFNHMGEYTCTSRNGFPKLATTSNPAHVAVNGVILDSTPQTVTGALQDVVKLECKVTSYPEPEIIWENSNNETVEGATFTSLGNNEYSSVLSVGPLDDTMSMGRYKCVVNSNADGVKSETKEFILPELIQAGSVSPAVIIIVILLLLLLVAVILAVLYNKGYICNKNRGEENAEDISVQMKDKDAEKGDDVGDANAQKEEHIEKEKEEQQSLMQKNGDK